MHYAENILSSDGLGYHIGSLVGHIRLQLEEGGGEGEREKPKIKL